MADYMTLMGAEDVRAAGNRMASAADEMQRASANISGALECHQRFLDDWLSRLERTITDAAVVSAVQKLDLSPSDAVVVRSVATLSAAARHHLLDKANLSVQHVVILDGGTSIDVVSTEQVAYG